MDIKRNIKSIINSVKRKEKIAMLHPGRCGSTVVGSLLNQHPDFHWSGEPFENLMDKGTLSKEQTIKVIKQREQDVISKIYSFATKYPSGMHLSKECINMDIPRYIELLCELKYKKFILITRRNHLKRVISILKGRQTGEWHSKQVKTKASPIEVPLENFAYGSGKSGSLIDFFKIMDTETELIIDTIGGKPLLHIVYETDIEESPLKAYRKICEFSGIKPLSPIVNLKKTNPFPLKKLISNFDEVQKYLSKTHYSWMLDD